MKNGEAVVFLAGVTAWVCGIALVKGFWMTALCTVLPPAAWVILVQHLMGVAA